MIAGRCSSTISKREQNGPAWMENHTDYAQKRNDGDRIQRSTGEIKSMTTIFIAGFMMGGIIGFVMAAILSLTSDQEDQEENKEDDNS